VVFTDLDATRIALRAASHLARDLNARVVLMVGEVVPYPLPLDSPPVSKEFADTVLADLAAEGESESTVRVFLCRDREETIRAALPHASVVLIGGKPWPWNRDRRFMRQLRADGHEVIAVRRRQVESLQSGSSRLESIA
jgi:hypothetical protein